MDTDVGGQDGDPAAQPSNRTLNRIVMQPLARLMRTVARMGNSFSWRDRVMALYGPFAMLALVFVWLVLVRCRLHGDVLGDRAEGWADAFHESGSSLLTLGFAPIDGTFLRALSFLEATLGLGLLALLITYLPTLYSSFQRRERQVALLEVRAGTPASALVMLTGPIGSVGWIALGISSRTGRDGSSTSRRATPRSRSSPSSGPHNPIATGWWLPERCSTLPRWPSRWSMAPAQPQAQLADQGRLRGVPADRRILRRRLRPEPAAGRPDQHHPGRVRCRVPANSDAAGVPLKADRDQAWLDFAGWRVNYDTVLLALAELTMAPYAPWTSDRSVPDHRQPRVRRWGSR